MRSMRVVIDAHMVGQRETGNETYIRYLVEALAQQRVRRDIEYTILTADEHPVRDWPPAGVNRRYVPLDPVRRLLWTIPRQVARSSADVLHVTYNAPVRVSCPVVVSVHDISFRLFPHHFSLRDLVVLALLVPLSMKRAEYILTLSESAKRDIVRYYHVPEERIIVTPLAASPRYRQLDDPGQAAEVLQRLDVRRDFILAVGNLQPRKNIPRLIEAYRELRIKGTVDQQLVIVGQAEWRGEEVYQAVAESGFAGDLILPGYVSDDDLMLLYNAASVFVYPSLYEGFGLPILEAMASGTPTVTSNVSSMPEVAGNAAVLVDPTDVHQIAQAIECVLLNPELRSTLRAKGLQRAKQFSWANVAQVTAEVYRAAAMHGSGQL